MFQEGNIKTVYLYNKKDVKQLVEKGLKRINTHK